MEDTVSEPAGQRTQRSHTYTGSKEATCNALDLQLPALELHKRLVFQHPIGQVVKREETTQQTQT